MIVKCAMSGRQWPVVAVLTLALMSPAFGYEYPLSSESIREAYFVGIGRDKKTSDFIEQYTHHFPVPPKGPYVAMIQLETPYVQIVERARQAINYNGPDAVQEFLGKPGVFRLHVQIYFTPSYTAVVDSKDGRPMARPDDFWRDFKIRLVQGEEIHTDILRGEALYAGTGTGRRTGVEVELQYPAHEINSTPARIEVLTPEGRKIETTFDLAMLR